MADLFNEKSVSRIDCLTVAQEFSPAQTISESLLTAMRQK